MKNLSLSFAREEEKTPSLRSLPKTRFGEVKGTQTKGAEEIRVLYCREKRKFPTENVRGRGGEGGSTVSRTFDYFAKKTKRLGVEDQKSAISSHGKMELKNGTVGRIRKLTEEKRVEVQGNEKSTLRKRAARKSLTDKKNNICGD